jgi:hypothetical protein
MTQERIVALRTFLERPGYALAVTLTLALGIGATTVMFSLLDAALLRAAPPSPKLPNYQLPTTNFQRPTSNCQLPTASAQRPAEVGRWQLAVGSWKLVVGSW